MGGGFAIVFGAILVLVAGFLLHLIYGLGCHDALTGDVCTGTDWIGQAPAMFLWLLLLVGVMLVVLGISSLRKR